MRIALVGVTGMVGEIMRNVLEERNFPISEFLPVASARSVGKTISFQGKDYTVIGLEDAVAQAPDFALFSAGGQTSLDWAPKFAAISNHSFFSQRSMNLQIMLLKLEQLN